ncbi:MAG: hypothetical protein EOO07_13075 [Chitinophagaceae bacterium]|nr:MAG: hypothetical protein EOO07_13075 [Chitinophagaceae bacterium]
MTKIRLILLTAVTLLFSSCFETKETYTLQENGAYKMEYSVTMGNMINLFQSMDEEIAAELAALKKNETSINYLSLLPDSVKKYYDSEALSLFSNTNLQLKIDIKNGIFDTKIISHGSSISALHSFLENYDDILRFGEENTMNALSPKETNEDAFPSHSGVLSNKDFEYTITTTSFERKLTEDAIERYKGRNSEQIERLLSNPAMDLNIINVLTINLPRPAKSIDNKNATLSDDKKQFVLKVNLIKAAGNPQLLNFKIVY